MIFSPHPVIAMLFRISTNRRKQLPEQLWNFIQNGLSKNVIIKSTHVGVSYIINYVDDQEISFSAGTRNGGNPELIGKSDFLKVVDGLKAVEEFNTSSTKELFLGTKIYRKRSPMFALLHASGIIEEC
jgi:hypothetical protein